MHISDTWRSRWVESKHKSDYGKFVLSAGKFYGDAEKDKGECCFVFCFLLQAPDNWHQFVWICGFLRFALFYDLNNTLGEGLVSVT